MAHVSEPETINGTQWRYISREAEWEDQDGNRKSVYTCNYEWFDGTAWRDVEEWPSYDEAADFVGFPEEVLAFGERIARALGLVKD